MRRALRDSRAHLVGWAREAARELRAAPELGLVALVILALPFEFSTDLLSISWLDVSRVGMAAAIAWFGWRLLHRRVTIGVPARGLVLAGAAVLLVETGSFVLTRWPNAPKELGAIVAYGLFGLAVSDSLRTRRRLWIATGVLMVSGFIVGAIGVAEQFGDFYLWKDRALEVLGRRNATFVDPNITARFYILVLVVALAVLAAQRLRGSKILSEPTLAAIGATVIVSTAGLVYTLSRAGWLIATGVMALWVPVAVRRRVNLSGFGMFVAIATFAVAIAASQDALSRAGQVPPAQGPVQPVATPGPGAQLATRTTTVVDPVLGALPIDDVRRYLFRAGVAMFEDHPLIGVGVGGFQPEILGPYRNFIPPDRQAAPESLEHADAIRIAAETGLVGLAAFAALLVAAAIGLARSAGRSWTNRTIAFALGLMLLVIVLSAQTEGRFYTEPYLWLVLGATAAFIGRGPDWEAPVPQAGVPATSSSTPARRAASRARS